ncbi:MAG TPA: hypothetical protein DCL58_08780 [Synergistaceae bacterium]|nr:hypothetical protein [Synergistaceae bacterium]
MEPLVSSVSFNKFRSLFFTSDERHETEFYLFSRHFSSIIKPFSVFFEMPVKHIYTLYADTSI